jgi:hypothetical protein
VEKGKKRCRTCEGFVVTYVGFNGELPFILTEDKMSQKERK